METPNDKLPVENCEQSHPMIPSSETVAWRFLDRLSEIYISERFRPHWDQSGALTFVTFRLMDSMPQEVVESWERQQIEWLKKRGLEDINIDNFLKRTDVPESLRRGFLKMRLERWNEDLDLCHGSCILRLRKLALVVAESLKFFDGARYDLERFVVMPNHVHLLVQMRVGWDLRKQCQNWLKFSARQINLLNGSRGHVWQSEPFDHVVRSAEQFEYLQNYIANNPSKAGLNENEYLLWKRCSC